MSARLGDCILLYNAAHIMLKSQLKYDKSGARPFSEHLSYSMCRYLHCFQNGCRIIYGQGYTEDDRVQYRSIVYSNIIQSMVAIVRAMEQLQIEYGHSDTQV